MNKNLTLSTLLLAAIALPAMAHADDIYVYGLAQSFENETCYVSDSVIVRKGMEFITSQEYHDQIEQERERWQRALDRQGITDTSTNSRRIVDRNRLGRDDAEDDRRNLIRSLKNSCTVVIVPW